MAEAECGQRVLPRDPHRHGRGAGSPRVLAAVLSLLLLAGSATAISPSDNKGYLLPMIRGFANNQVVGMKEVLALGQLLDRTVVLTDLLEGGFEEQKPGIPRLIDFDEVFDRTGIQEMQNVTDMAALRRGGWKGHVDLVLFFSGKGSDELWLRRWQYGFNISVKGVKRIDMHAFSCLREAKGLEAVREQIKGHHNWERGKMWLIQDADMAASPCHKAFMDVTKRLNKSTRLQQLAKQYIAEHLGGGPYVALHARPYPDSCLKVWRKPLYDWNLAEKITICDRPGGRQVYDTLGPAMRAALDAVNVTRLFVMAEPSIRHRLNELLGKHGMTPHYMPLELLFTNQSEAAAHAKTNASGVPVNEAEVLKRKAGAVSILGLLEAEVAVRSKFFFATSGTSSLAGMVIQQRSALALPHDSVITFEQLGTLPASRWPKPPWLKVP